MKQRSNCQHLLDHWKSKRVPEKHLLACKEIKPVHPKGNQSWIFDGRTDAETETPILWPPDVKSWLTGKNPDAGKDWRRELKGMRGFDGWWHHWLSGHEFEWAWGDGEGQEILTCCSSWGCKESDTTEPLNNNNRMVIWRWLRHYFYSEGDHNLAKKGELQELK